MLIVVSGHWSYLTRQSSSGHPSSASSSPLRTLALSMQKQVDQWLRRSLQCGRSRAGRPRKLSRWRAVRFIQIFHVHDRQRRMQAWAGPECHMVSSLVFCRNTCVTPVYSLYFHLQLDFVAELPPLSLVVYHVTKASVGSAYRAQYTFHRRGNPPTVQTEHFQVSRPQGPEAGAPLSLSNKHVQIWSSPETGLLQVRLKITNLFRRILIVRVEFFMYLFKM